MPFQFQVLGVRYESRDTVISGQIISGEIGGPEFIKLPTASGQAFKFWMTGMQAPGPGFPIRPGHKGLVEISLSGHPPSRDIAFPCVGIAEGGSV